MLQETTNVINGLLFGRKKQNAKKNYSYANPLFNLIKKKSSLQTRLPNLLGFHALHSVRLMATTMNIMKCFFKNWYKKYVFFLNKKIGEHRDVFQNFTKLQLMLALLSL